MFSIFLVSWHSVNKSQDAANKGRSPDAIRGLVSPDSVFAERNKIGSRTQAQRWLQRNGYQPSHIHLSALQRLGAKLFSAKVQFDDHSLADRIAGRYQVVTVESVIRFLHHYDPQATQSVVGLD